MGGGVQIGDLWCENSKKLCLILPVCASASSVLPSSPSSVWFSCLHKDYHACPKMDPLPLVSLTFHVQQLKLTKKNHSISTQQNAPAPWLGHKGSNLKIQKRLSDWCIFQQVSTPGPVSHGSLRAHLCGRGEKMVAKETLAH